MISTSQGSRRTRARRVNASISVQAMASSPKPLDRRRLLMRWNARQR